MAHRVVVGAPGCGLFAVEKPRERVTRANPARVVVTLLIIYYYEFLNGVFPRFWSGLESNNKG